MNSVEQIPAGLRLERIAPHSHGRCYTAYRSGFSPTAGFCFTFNDSKCLHAVNEVYLS